MPCVVRDRCPVPAFRRAGSGGCTSVADSPTQNSRQRVIGNRPIEGEHPNESQARTCGHCPETVALLRVLKRSRCVCTPALGQPGAWQPARARSPRVTGCRPCGHPWLRGVRIASNDSAACACAPFEAEVFSGACGAEQLTVERLGHRTFHYLVVVALPRTSVPVADHVVRQQSVEQLDASARPVGLRLPRRDPRAWRYRAQWLRRRSFRCEWRRPQGAP